MSNPQVTLRGHIDGPSGYAKAARSLASCLIHNGIDLKLCNRVKESNRIDLGVLQSSFEGRWVPHDYPSDITIFLEPPQFFYKIPGSFNIGYTMTEISQACAKDVKGKPGANWVAQMNMMDVIWVPCQHSRKVFKASGVKVPIEVVPLIVPDIHGMDPLFTRNPEVVSLLSTFQWTERKDPSSLILGYLQAKIGTSNLWLKTYRSGFGQSQAGIAQLIQTMRSSFHTPPDNNSIHLILDKLTDRDMHKMYASVDAYVTTSRGEGFCLPAVEAMMCGKPVMAIGETSFKDFLTEENAYILPSFTVPVFNMYNINWYSPEYRWFQVQFDKYIETLERLYEDWKTKEQYRGEQLTRLQIKGHIARTDAKNKFSPQAVWNDSLSKVLATAVQSVASEKQVGATTIR